MYDFDDEYDFEEENKPKEIARYKKTANMLKLAFNMATRPNGVTLKDIENEFGVKRRTAERMRDCLLYAFPNQIEELYISEDDTNTKHWGFNSSSLLSPAVSFSSDEMVCLERIQKTLTNVELQEKLAEILSKLKIIVKSSNKTVDANIEAIMQTEGYAVKQLPGRKFNPKYLIEIRKAMDSQRYLRASYEGKEGTLLLKPLGVIYASKTYLVARDKSKPDTIRLYIMSKFKYITTDMIGTTYQKEQFDLQAYVNESFGVYHSDIMEVKLHFAPELTKEVLEYNFHPTQKIKEEKDGSCTVTLKASGTKEIMWHVFTWGKGCQILAPAKLRDEYYKYLAECLENNK